MTTSTASYSLPERMEPDMESLLGYWKNLIRGENSMPFSDDVVLSRIPGPTGRLILMAAFEDPERFRFEHAGEDIAARYGAPLQGAFADELRSRPPLEEFVEQCLATARDRAATYFRSSSPSPYARLLLPTWGEGHVMLLLGAVAASTPESGGT